MARFEDMMILPAESRREYFRKAYSLNMAKAHAEKGFAWPIDRLPDMVERAFSGILSRKVPIGPAFDETMKFFGLKTQKSLFAFLEI